MTNLTNDFTFKSDDCKAFKIQTFKIIYLYFDKLDNNNKINILSKLLFELDLEQNTMKYIANRLLGIILLKRQLQSVIKNKLDLKLDFLEIEEFDIVSGILVKLIDPTSNVYCNFFLGDFTGYDAIMSILNFLCLLNVHFKIEGLDNFLSLLLVQCDFFENELTGNGISTDAHNIQVLFY